MSDVKNIIFDIGGVLIENSESAIKNKFNLSEDEFHLVKKKGYVIKPSLLGKNQ